MTSFRFLTLAFVLTAATALVNPIAAAEGPTGHGHGYTPAIGEPGKASAATRTVAIKLGDNFFEPETLPVKAGETIRFVLTNTGTLLHEFNIGTAATHAEHQKEMAMMVDHGMLTPTGIDHEKMKMDHSGMGGMTHHHDDPNTVLVEPGQTKELVWKFSKTLNLEFACNMPGHYEAGMVGKFQPQR